MSAICSRVAPIGRVERRRPFEMRASLLRLPVATLDGGQLAKQQGAVRRGHQGLLVPSPASSSLPAAAAVRAFATASSTARNRSASIRAVRSSVGSAACAASKLAIASAARSMRLRETAADQRRSQRRLQRDGLVEARDGAVEIVPRQRDVTEPRGGRCAVGRALPHVVERALRSARSPACSAFQASRSAATIRRRRRRLWRGEDEVRVVRRAGRRAAGPSARTQPWPRSRSRARADAASVGLAGPGLRHPLEQTPRHVGFDRDAFPGLDVLQHARVAIQPAHELPVVIGASRRTPASHAARRARVAPRSTSSRSSRPCPVRADMRTDKGYAACSRRSSSGPSRSHLLYTSSRGTSLGAHLGEHAMNGGHVPIALGAGRIDDVQRRGRPRPPLRASRGTRRPACAAAGR